MTDKKKIEIQGEENENQEQHESQPENTELTDLREKYAQLEAENSELKDKQLRLSAEFDNYKKRQKKLFTQMTEQFRDELITRYLEVLDNFERALAACPIDSQDDYIEGFRMIGQQMLDFLKQENILPIDEREAPFDPNLHEAIHRMPSEEHPPGTVLEIAQKGYRRGDRLIRPAKVVVSHREDE